VWYSCAVANAWFDDLTLPVELTAGIRLEPVPDWVKAEEALKDLSWRERERIRSAEVTFAAEYEADALGSPDPNWNGTSQRGIQSVVDDKFALANTALWIVKPSRLTSGPVLHFDRKGDATSLRQDGSLRPVALGPDEDLTELTAADLELGRQLLVRILDLRRRDSSVWSAVWMMVSAIAERNWELRYLLEWVALEALFGPDNSGETTHRLAQRIGLFLGNDSEERKRLFGEAKEGYR